MVHYLHLHATHVLIDYRSNLKLRVALHLVAIVEWQLVGLLTDKIQVRKKYFEHI